jgi:hypothetical protein
MVKDYCAQLLKQVTEELNIHRVILRVEDITTEYWNHTFVPNGEKPKIGFKGDWRLASMFFTGDVLKDMAEVREIVKVGLKQRADAKIKVRQPLDSITIVAHP